MDVIADQYPHLKFISVSETGPCDCVVIDLGYFSASIVFGEIICDAKKYAYHHW